jgi:hypothetical protein
VGSQTDLDQGGTSRQWVNTYLGPSVGWVRLPGSNILTVLQGGTTTAVVGTSLIIVNFNGAVTIVLPTAIHPSVPAGVIAPPFADIPCTIVDVGGFAASHPITIQPASGAETIMGLASIQITSQYGAVGLRPSNTLKGWTSL